MSKSNNHLQLVNNDEDFKTIQFKKLEVPKGNDIKIPNQSFVQVDVTKPKMKQTSLLIDNYNYFFGDSPTATTDRSWADKVTNEVLAFNIYKYLIDNEEFEMLPSFEQCFIDELNDQTNNGKQPMKAGNDIQKGLIVAMYNWCVSKYPRGLQGQVMEYYTGLTPKRVSNILSRISCTYQELRNEGMEISRYKNKVVINNKTVYFVKHTDNKTQGGYMPKWVENKLQDFFTEKYFKEISASYQVKLDSEMRGSVG